MRFKLVEDLLMETSLKELQKFATMVKKAVSKDCTVKANSDHQCVDIFKDNKLVGQAYPEYGRNEEDGYTLKRIESTDEIQEGDILYVKRPKRISKSTISGIKYIKRVSGIHTTSDSFNNDI